MSYEAESFSRQFPTLVQLCQRVASANVDLISSFGSDLRYALIKPILEGCDGDTLLRLEEASPQIKTDTLELWKGQCLRGFPLVFTLGTPLNEPNSWRDHYFVLREAEAKRLELVSSRIRNQRLQAEERKKEREVKFTDNVPSQKRVRGWYSNVQPRTLFQKARSDTTRIQKSMYHSRMLPPMEAGRTYRVIQNVTSATLIPPAPSSQPSCVKVNTVRRPVLPLLPSKKGSQTEPLDRTKPLSSATEMSSAFKKRKLSDGERSKAVSQLAIDSVLGSDKPITVPQVTPLKTPLSSRKDPLASLFMPKHRAHSQLIRR